MLLCFVMIFSMMTVAVPVYAAPVASTTLTVAADKTTAAPGDEITYTITMGSVSDLGSIQMVLDIPAGLTYVAGSRSLASGLKATLGFDDIAFTENMAIGRHIINGAASAADYASAADTVIATFKCTVDAGATGTLEVGLKELEFISCQTFEDITSRFSVVKTAVAISGVTPPPATYTVSFNANGGTGSMADVTGVSAGAYTLPANGFTAPDGKQFKGWSTGASGAVIEGTTYNVTGDVTLYAIWEDKPHTHTYNTTWSTDSTKHWHECSVCGNKKDEAAHTPGAAATETTPQTCTACGYVIKEAIGHVHSYTEKNTDAKYLKSAATCTAKAVYYYSCSCGEKGTETFESGETLAHTWETKWVNNDGKHWHECTVCKTKSDEADHAFEWKIDKEATVTEAGAKHEECKVCGYKKAAIAIGKLAPSIIDGGNAKWNKGGENNLTFKSDAAFSDFVEVLVDGRTITAENYEKREGSIIIQLKASYLATLAEGEHTLTIRSTSGDATTKFTVEAEIVSPPTGSINVWVWIIICVVSLGVGATSVVFTIRKRKTA